MFKTAIATLNKALAKQLSPSAALAYSYVNVEPNAS